MRRRPPGQLLFLIFTNMPRLSEIDVKYRGGYRGSWIDINDLIAKEIPMDIVEFRMDASQVKGCENYCRMQIKIGGKPYVTWHSSAILSGYLEDCMNQQATDGVVNFPIEWVIIYTGDDGGYYLKDAGDAKVPTEAELNRLIKRRKGGGRR